jgi:tetratricopeptide (TPR) repeat protein
MWQSIFLCAVMVLVPSANAVGQTNGNSRNAVFYFEKGEEALTKKSYKTALAHFNECLRLSPYYYEAYYSRALAKEGLGDKQGALTDYNIFLENKPDNKEALFSRAVTRYDYGQWAVAKEDFLKLLSMPSGGETNTVYFQTDQSADGVTKAFTAQNNLKPTILNYLGLIEAKLKNFAGADVYLTTAIELNGNEPDYYLNRGMARLESGDSVKALSDFEKTLVLNPESSLALHNLAIIKKSSAQTPESEVLLTEAIEKNPKLPYPYAERGLLRMKSGNLKDALSDYDEAIKLNATDPDYWLNRGIIKEQLKNLEGALTDYAQVITLKPDHEKGWLNHGNVLVKLNRLNEAIEDYTVAITHYPTYALAHYNRALTYHRQGKKADACKDLETAKKLGAVVDANVMSTICGK